MAVRRELRWVVLAVAVVAILLGISALALTKPGVVWMAGVPRCPHCRAEVEAFSSRCRTCREEYDWQLVPEEDSPLSEWSLSALEDQALQARVAVVGREAAAARVAEALSLPLPAAKAYLEKVGLGRCGWCGGTGLDLAAPEAASESCPACLGRGACIACDGDRRVRVGEQAAERDFARYRAAMMDLSPLAPLDVQRKEARRLAEGFLDPWHGTEQATRLWFWPQWLPKGGDGTARAPRIVEASRARLDTVLSVLAKP